jgi:plastocyanin
MQFTTFALPALSIGSAFAAGATIVHVVKVGNANGTLAYSPNSIQAAVGDMVQFQFAPQNHTVTQSTFDQPCQPISMNSNVTGIYSGFMPVTASSTETPTYTILINNTTPMWIYCSQGRHCQNGMTMVINVNPTANATRTLANFQALAAKATVNLPGDAVSNGTAGEIASSGSSTSSGSGSYGSATSSASSSSSTSTSSNKSTATSMKASGALSLAGLLALGMALFV